MKKDVKVLGFDCGLKRRNLSYDCERKINLRCAHAVPCEKVSFAKKAIEQISHHRKDGVTEAKEFFEIRIRVVSPNTFWG